MMTIRRLLSPQEAYDLAQRRQWQALKQAAISPHFSWGEVFVHCSDEAMAACGLQIFRNALRQAGTMEQVRLVFEKPIHVHSWYRDRAHNARIGGAPQSWHLKALATDFHVDGMVGKRGNQQVQTMLDAQAFMLRCGLEYTGGSWTHVDSRGYKSRFGPGMI